MHRIILYSGRRWSLSAQGSISRALSTTSSSASNEDSVAKSLPIVIPGMSNEALQYVKDQVDLIQKFTPEDSQTCSWEKAEAIFNAHYPSLLMEPGGNTFKVNSQFRRHFTLNSVLPYRYARAFKSLDIERDLLLNNLSFFHVSLPKLLSYFKEFKIMGVNSIPSLPKARKTKLLRGRIVQDLARDLLYVLEALDMTNCIDSIERIKRAPIHGGGITFADLNRRAVLSFIHETFPEDLIEDARAELRKVDNIGPKKCKEKLMAKINSGVNAKDLVMNYWLFYKFLGNEVFSSKYTKHLLHICPVESLVVLNDFYLALLEINENLSVDEFMREFADISLKSMIFPSIKLPLSLRMKIFSEVGFTNDELIQIFSSTQQSLSVVEKNSSKSSSLKVTSPNYIPTMQKRLRILRKDGVSFGIITPNEYMSVMKSWSSFLKSVEELHYAKSSGKRLDYHVSRLRVHAFTNKSSKSFPMLKFLESFLKGESNEEKKKLISEFSNYCQMRIPPKRVQESYEFLLERGFSKDQIKKAVPIICFPKVLIEEKLKEMKEMSELSSTWDSETKDINFLHVCLYFLEKEFHFTKDGIWDGFRVDNFSPELYEEVRQELDLDLSVQSDGVSKVSSSPSKSSSFGMSKSYKKSGSLYSSRIMGKEGLRQATRAMNTMAGDP